MNDLNLQKLKKQIRDEKISFVAWILFIMITVYLNIYYQVPNSKYGFDSWVVIWCILATRSFYKIKIIQLKMNFYINKEYQI